MSSDGAVRLGALRGKLTMLEVACRRSEARACALPIIDWSGGRITIEQVVVEHDGKRSIRQGTKSLAGHRTISVAPIVVEGAAQVAGPRCRMAAEGWPVLAGP